MPWAMVKVVIALTCVAFSARRVQHSPASSRKDPSVAFDVATSNLQSHPQSGTIAVVSPMRALSEILLALRPVPHGVDSPRAHITKSRLGHHNAGGTMATATVVPNAEIAKLFGRFAEKKVYLDKEVGACCHSACSDCEWRLPSGGYRFDHLMAGRPKWIPCYLSRDYIINNGGCHVPQWVAALFPDGADKNTLISRADFDARIRSLVYTAPMGPTGSISADDTDISSEALDLLWIYLSEGIDDPATSELEASIILQRLQDMSLDEDREGSVGEGPDTIIWKGFAKALGADPNQRL